MKLDQEFWNQRWESNQTGWDIGYPSPVFSEYFQQVDKNASILIPGCGNAYEAEFLLQEGFQHITLIDIAPKAVDNLREKFQNHPQIEIICGDYFEHEGQYDYIIEQTFFCALPVEKRDDVVQKTSQLLNADGIWVGLLFNKDFGQPLPPFGGSREEYMKRFSPYFEILKMEDCYNSIPPRKGTELFFEAKKK